MLSDDRLMAEIRETNLSYLILSQSLIRRDRAQALYQLGVSDEVASLIENLSPAQLLRIAQSNRVMCRLRFEDEVMWSLLADCGAQNGGEDRSASLLHASILMSGNFAETLDDNA